MGRGNLHPARHGGDGKAAIRSGGGEQLTRSSLLFQPRGPACCGHRLWCRRCVSCCACPRVEGGQKTEQREDQSSGAAEVRSEAAQASRGAIIRSIRYSGGDQALVRLRRPRPRRDGPFRISADPMAPTTSPPRLIGMPPAKIMILPLFET